MSKIHLDNLDIQVDTKEGRFYFFSKDNRDAELHYQLETESPGTVINFTHTYVPPELRNIGIGQRLVEKGVQFARANGYKIKTSCSFVADYLERHPEFQKLATAP